MNHAVNHVFGAWVEIAQCCASGSLQLHVVVLHSDHTYRIVDDIAGIVTIVPLHESWISNLAIITDRGLDPDTAMGLLHDDSEDKAMIDLGLRGICFDRGAKVL